MSLHRLALRLAAVEALTGADGASGRWPTIAGNLVYDSLKETVSGLEELNAKPILVVYTEDDRASGEGTARTAPDECMVTLVVEAMFALRGAVAVPLPDGKTQNVPTIDTVVSDRVHEGLLDVLEANVRRQLDPRHTVPRDGLWSKIAMEVRTISSVPLRDADKTTRLAQRTITFEIKVAPDEWPIAETDAATGIDRLPEPLRTVARALPPGSSGRHLCDQVAEMIAPPGELVRLGSIRIGVGMDRVPQPGEIDAAGEALPQEGAP